MRKALSLVSSILFIVAIYMVTNRYFQKSPIITAEKNEEVYELGKRFLASDKIEYEVKNLPAKKKSVISEKNFKISEQFHKTDEEILEDSFVEGPEASVNDVTRKYSDNTMPEEIQNFLNPSFGTDKGSKSGTLYNSQQAFFGNVKNSTSNSSSASSQASGSSQVVKEIRIQGRVVPLVDSITEINFSSEYSAYAAPTCLNPKVGIYLTEDLLKLGTSPIQEQILKPGASFSFVPSPQINLTKPLDYSLQVTGCDVYFSRIITDFNDLQDIGFVSTLISFIQVSPSNISATNASQSLFKSLVTKMELTSNTMTSFEDIFTELSTSNLTTAFNSTFNGSSPDVLKSSLPIIKEVSLPSIFSEEVDHSLSVNVSHWSPDYTMGVEWYINGVSLGFGNNWIWRPSGNSPASVQVKILVGKKKNGFNEVDQTYPYHQLVFNRNILNTVSPIAPGFELNSPIADISSTPNLPLNLLTGVDDGSGHFANCSSFESMAITETPTSPDPSAFNLICSTENIQPLTYTLNISNRTDGDKTLYLWAKDGFGDISSTPKIVHLTLDQSAPVIEIPALLTLYGGGTNHLLSWRLSDHTVNNTQSMDVEFFDGSSWISLPSVSLQNGPLVEQVFSTSYQFPDTNITGAKFRISATDLLGHSNSVESSAFNIETAVIQSSPTTHNFGDIAAGSTSAAQTIVFSNLSTWSSGICSTPGLTGHSAQFTILSENCSGVSLAASGSCSVSVRANPALRNPYSADLNMTCGGSIGIATVMVTGDNNPPVLGSTSAQTLNEDNVLAFSLVTASDLDGDSLVYQIVSSPVHGALTNCLGGTSDVTCSYTPDLNYNGTDSFSYRAYDGFNYSATVIVSLTINPINDAPSLALTQSETTDEDTVLSFSLGVGSDIENDTLNYIVVSSTSSGVLTCTGGLSRNCSYAPASDFNGTDSFTYKVNDGFLDSNISTVTITVNPINDAPVGPSNYSLSLNEDDPTALTLQAGSDIDLPAQTLTYILDTAPAHGILSGCVELGATTDRTCLYTPDANYNGPDSFSYKVCDPQICSSVATVVNLTIDQVNDAPVLVADQSYTLDDNQYVDFTLNGATDIDLPAQTLSYKLNAAVSSGVLTGCIDETGWSTGIDCRYTPPVNFQGTVSFTYKAFDGEDASVLSSTVTFYISDKTPSPVPSITLYSDYITNLGTASVTNSSCTDIDGLFISMNSSDPASTDGGWVPCTTADGALTASLSGFNGIQKIYVWSKDQYGNVSARNSVDVVYDSIAPVIVITSTNNVQGNETVTVGFTSTELHATSAMSFEIRYNDGTSWSDWTVPSTNGPHIAQAFSTTVNTPNSDNTTLSFEVKYKDVVGNEGSASVQFKSDLSEPYVDLISINGGATDATNNNIQMTLQAHDDLSKVTWFCFKYNDSSKPSKTSSCWKSVSAPSPGVVAASTISFNGYYYQIGFTKGTYTVYAWVKDEAGLVSNNSAIIDIDKYAINFDPGTPPRVLAIQATNTDSPSNPVSSVDQVVGNGGDVFIKWNAQDTEGLDAAPIKIEYSINDSDFLPLGPDTFIPNGVNAGCTIDARFTGCTVLSAPSATYFKIRVIAKDSLGTVVYLNSPPLNEQGLRILAGNTENGLGGSALSALFYTYGSAKSVSYQMKNTFAVSEDGKFFYVDPRRGLIWVDPATGVLKTFIPTTGVATGDGGSVLLATLISPTAVTIDAYNHLLIWDNNLLRRVNLETMEINTIIGGGAQSDPTGTINASDFALGGFSRSWGTLIPLPNGDILFTSPSGGANRRYRAADQKVEKMSIVGLGFDNNPTDDWNSYSKLDFGVTYNTTTSQLYFMAQGFYKSYTGDAYPHYTRLDVATGSESTPYEGYGPYDLNMITKTLVTGLDGKMYLVDRFRTTIFLYDHINNTQIAVVGTGGIGSVPCAEGTPATSCAVDIDTFFVTKNGRLYFVDNGVIRTIDDSGNVISLFGQFPSFGNGELATIARFGTIRDFKLGKYSATNDKIIVMDGFSSEFREITIDSTVEKISNVGVGWDGPWRFEVDPNTGDIFVPQGGPLYQYSRTLNTYTAHMNAGAYSYSDPASDGRPESEVLLHGYSNYTSGFINGKIFLNKHHWVGYNIGCLYKSYDLNDSFRQEHFLGNGSCNGVGPNFGDPLGPQYFGVGNITEITDPVDSVTKLLFNEPGTGTIYTKSASGTLEPYISGIQGFTSFATKIDGSGLNVFYCSGGRLYKYNKNSTSYVQLSWLSPTLYCTDSRTIVYNPERNSIIFMFNQNGLDGIGEYKL